MAYFAKFTTNGFTPNPTASFADEFDRLAQHMGWGKGSTACRRQRTRAVEAELDGYYGSSSKLDSWKVLCTDVGIGSPPNSITQCRKALAKVHVNIYDVIDARRTGAQVMRFKSIKQLANYSKNNNKIFPKREAKDDGFLKALLRPIWG